MRSAVPGLLVSNERQEQIDVVCDRQDETEPQRLRLHRRGVPARPAATGRPTPAEVRDIIAKSLAKEPLAVEETAVLLAADEPELVEEIFDAARQLKRDVYGNRIVLFAPLYVGNECTNDCPYCAFRRSNREQVRRTLDDGRDPPAGRGAGAARGTSG